MGGGWPEETENETIPSCNLSVAGRPERRRLRKIVVTKTNIAVEKSRLCDWSNEPIVEALRISTLSTPRLSTLF